MQKSETIFVIIRIDSQKDMHILEVFNIVLLFFQCILVSGSGWLCPRPCDYQGRRKDRPEPSESSYAYRAQRKVGSAYDMVPHVSGHGGPCAAGHWGQGGLLKECPPS